MTSPRDPIDEAVAAVNTWLAEQNLEMAVLIEHPAFVAAAALSTEHSTRSRVERHVFQMKRELRTALYIYDSTGSYIELADCARRWLDG